MLPDFPQGTCSLQQTDNHWSVRIYPVYRAGILVTRKITNSNLKKELKLNFFQIIYSFFHYNVNCPPPINMMVTLVYPLFNQELSEDKQTTSFLLRLAVPYQCRNINPKRTAWSANMLQSEIAYLFIKLQDRFYQTSNRIPCAKGISNPKFTVLVARRI